MKARSAKTTILDCFNKRLNRIIQRLHIDSFVSRWVAPDISVPFQALLINGRVFPCSLPRSASRSLGRLPNLIVASKLGNKLASRVNASLGSLLYSTNGVKYHFSCLMLRIAPIAGKQSAELRLNQQIISSDLGKMRHNDC